MSKLHDIMKNREASVTSVVDGKTIIDYFNQNADEFPDYPALNTPINDEYSGWDSTSWSEYRELVHNLAAGLIDIGFSQGDNGFIVSDNTKEHFISDLSIMHAGGTPSTIYKQLKGGQIAYISNLLDAKIVLAIFNVLPSLAKRPPIVDKVSQPFHAPTFLGSIKMSNLFKKLTMIWSRVGCSSNSTSL